MGCEAAHEGAVLTLRAEVGIDLPQPGFDVVIVDYAHRLHRECGGDFDDPSRLQCERILGRGFGDEDHVDVTHIVELASTCLAHSDD